jgi:hypothetical protein
LSNAKISPTFSHHGWEGVCYLDVDKQRDDIGRYIRACFCGKAGDSSHICLVILAIAQISGKSCQTSLNVISDGPSVPREMAVADIILIDRKSARVPFQPFTPQAA